MPTHSLLSQQCWTDFSLSTVNGDQQYVKASAKYFAFGMAGGGGPVIVHSLDRPGRFEPSSCPYVTGHAGSVLDIEWNPFDDSMMATASEDTNIKLWKIPEDWEVCDEKGMPKAGKGLSESIADLTGHQKKVTLLRYNHTVNNALLSTSADYTVKLWDVEKSTAVNTFDGFSNLVHDLVWDHTGDMYAFSCKDKQVRIMDGRTGAEADSFQAHDGTKSVKVVYVNDSGKMFTFGASRQSTREIRVWDLKDLSKPLHTETVDTAAGAMIPLWDADTNVLYQCGKGDGIVRIYEYEDKSPFLFKLNDGFRSNTPGKGYCMVPKRGVDVMKHEHARILKITNTAGVHPLNFYVPRKSDAFQDDINPPTAAAIPAHSLGEWLEGSSKNAIKISLNPEDNGKQVVEEAAPKKQAFKSMGQLKKELADATKKIEELQGGAPVAANGDSKNGSSDLQAKLDEVNAKLQESTKKAEESALEVTKLKAKLQATIKELDAAAQKIELLEAELKEAKAAPMENGHSTPKEPDSIPQETAPSENGEMIEEVAVVVPTEEENEHENSKQEIPPEAFL